MSNQVYFEGQIRPEDFEAMLNRLFPASRELESCDFNNGTWYYVQLTVEESPIFSGMDSMHVATWENGVGMIRASAEQYMSERTEA